MIEPLLLKGIGVLFVLCLGGVSSSFIPHRTTFHARTAIHEKSTAAWSPTTTTQLKSSVANNPNVPIESNDNGDEPKGGTTMASPDSMMDLPWTDFQKWALRDNVSKYLVSIPRPGAQEPQLYVLWRTMSREIVELSGYPVAMLQMQLERVIRDGDAREDESLPPGLRSTPDALPLLDEYTFSPTGGLTGKVYGIPGLLDGTVVQTSSVKEVEATLPKGFVMTEDGAVAYELGVPLRTELDLDYSLGGVSRTAARAVEGMTTNGRDALVEATKGTKSGMIQPSLMSDDADGNLARLGVTTAILLAGAEAVNLLSHHLTVNVFWV